MNKEFFNCKSCSREPTESINVHRVIEKLDAFFAENDLEGAKEIAKDMTEVLKNWSEEKMNYAE